MEQAEGRTRCDLGTLRTEHLEDEESTVSSVRCHIPLSPVRLSAELMAYVVFDKLTFSSRREPLETKWKRRVRQNLTM
ncbi:uncharacterized [Tachysurus ichikawai]